MCDMVIYIVLTIGMKKKSIPGSFGKQRFFFWQNILKEISHFKPAINKEGHFCFTLEIIPSQNLGFLIKLCSGGREMKNYELQYTDFFC